MARLSEQLRRFIDDKAFLENRRIMQILRDIEAGALRCRDTLPDGVFMELDEPVPRINLVMERPLFTPAAKPVLDGRIADSDGEIVPADALINHVYVDKDRLESRIRQSLQTRSQISLPELVGDVPLEQGLAELVAYLGIAADDPASIIDDRQHQTLEWTEHPQRTNDHCRRAQRIERQ